METHTLKPLNLSFLDGYTAYVYIPQSPPVLLRGVWGPTQKASECCGAKEDHHWGSVQEWFVPWCTPKGHYSHRSHCGPEHWLDQTCSL